jgi:hypothetical protein
MMICKTLSFRTALEDNFGVMIRVASRRMKHTLRFFRVRKFNIARPSTIVTAEGLVTSRPCIEQPVPGVTSAHWAAKPVVPDLDLDRDEDVPYLNLVIHPLERPEVVAPSNLAKLQAQAVRQIKRFSHSRKKMEIEAYIQNYFVTGDEFALGRLISVFRPISDRIAHFSQGD